MTVSLVKTYGLSDDEMVGAIDMVSDWFGLGRGRKVPLVTAVLMIVREYPGGIEGFRADQRPVYVGTGVSLDKAAPEGCEWAGYPF